MVSSYSLLIQVKPLKLNMHAVVYNMAIILKHIYYFCFLFSEYLLYRCRHKYIKDMTYVQTYTKKTCDFFKRCEQLSVIISSKNYYY